MKSNPILEEVWRIKEQLAAEADYDVDKFFDNLRKWSDEHPHQGPVVHSAEELQQFIASKQRKPAEQSEMALNEKPPKYGAE